MKDENLTIVFGKEKLVRCENVLSDSVRVEEPGSEFRKRGDVYSCAVCDLLDSKMVPILSGCND